VGLLPVSCSGCPVPPPIASRRRPRRRAARVHAIRVRARPATRTRCVPSSRASAVLTDRRGPFPPPCALQAGTGATGAPWIACWRPLVPPARAGPCGSIQKALIQAVRLFWRNGAAATSVDDLSRTLHLSHSSLYATLGDQRTLFLKALKGDSQHVNRRMARTCRRRHRRLLACMRSSTSSLFDDEGWHLLSAWSRVREADARSNLIRATLLFRCSA